MTNQCRLVCSLGQYVWRPTLRHPFRQMWAYGETPCSCGRRTWAYRELITSPRKGRA